MSWSDMADRMLGVAVRTFSHTDQDGDPLVEYLPKIGAAYEIKAVFDKAHLTVDPNTGATVSSTNPILGIQLSQMAAEPRQGDRVRIGGESGQLYSVAELQPDGIAGALLKLKAL